MGNGKTILIIEDDHILLDLYKEILELYNYDVQTALNGIEGIKKFKQTNPSLVIIEGEMPKLDGYDTFKKIKELDEKANVIIVTGGLEFEPKNQEALNKGVIKIILKPVLVNELLILAKKYTQTNIEKRFEMMDESIIELKIKTEKFIKKLNEKLTT